MGNKIEVQIILITVYRAVLLRHFLRFEINIGVYVWGVGVMLPTF
jgi:hypothetical protein